MSMIDKQNTFTGMVAKLIVFAQSKGYKAGSFGEAYRTPEQARLNAKTGQGSVTVAITQRLAVDFKPVRRQREVG